MTPEKQNNTVEGLKEILNKFESFSAIIERMTLFVRELSEKDVNLLAGKLNDSFYKALESGNTKDGKKIDFNSAMNAKVENSVGII